MNVNYALNWVFFVAYGLIMLFIGYLGYRKTKSDNAFSLAERNLPLWVTIPLFGAAFASAASLLGYTGFAYRNGWAMITVYTLGAAGGWLLLQLFSLKLRRKVEWHTYPDMMAGRFNSQFMRGWMAVFNIIYMMIFIAMSIIGAGKILTVFLGLNYYWGITILFVVFMVYTIFGGMYSVAWTNVVQWVFMLIVALIAAVGGLSLTGGLSNLNASLAKISPALLTANNGGKLATLYIVGVFVGMVTAVSSALYYHRIAYSAKSRRVAAATYGFTALPMLLFYFGLLLAGLAGRVMLPDLKDPELALPTLVTLLPPFAGGIVMAGIISAMHSTVDNQLLSSGVMGSHDIYRAFFNKDASGKALLAAGRIATLITGLGAMAIAVWKPALIITIYTVVVVFTVPCTLFPILVMAMYWRRTTKEAAIVGTIFGCVGAIIWFFISKVPAPLVILPLNFIVIVVVSLVTRPPEAKQLATFFDVKGS